MPPIILISHGFQTNYERGFSNGLSKNFPNVTLISSDRTDYGGLAAAIKTVNLRGSQEESRSPIAKAWNMFSYHVKLMLYTLLHPLSVVHIIGLIDPPLFYGVLEGLWFRLTSRKYVLTVHNLLPHDRHTKTNLLLHGWSFRLPHQLIVHTPKMAKDLQERYNISPLKIVVMEHGIESDGNFRTPSDPPRDRHQKHLLFFGKIAPYKGLDLLLSALSDINKPFQLTIAGACPDLNYHQKIKELIQKHPQRQSINWLDGFIPEKEMEELFQSSDTLILPYRHIDQSGVLFQALRFGVPIIASDVGDFTRYITTDIGEVFKANSITSLKLSIETLLARHHTINRTDIREFGKKFKWAETVKVLKPIYQQN